MAGTIDPTVAGDCVRPCFSRLINERLLLESLGTDSKPQDFRIERKDDMPVSREAGSSSRFAWQQLRPT